MLEESEARYLNDQTKEKVVKLENFKKKIFAVGLEEDYLRSKRELT